jgi:AbrB family looped-hinge helix DNA binding protein
MKSPERQSGDQAYVTVSTKGQLVIPAPIREALGIEPGTRIAIRREGARVILDPETLASKLRLIDDMHGCTAGHGSGTDLLLEERRLERQRELAEEGW